MIIIKTKQEYHTAMAEIETYLKKGFANLTEKEERRLDLLSEAAEVWEKMMYPIPRQTSIQELLVYIMRQRDINQNKLSDDLKISRSLLSEILGGKKKANLVLLKSLHSKYQVDGNMLLELV